MIVTFGPTMFESLPLTKEEADFLYETMLRGGPPHEAMQLAADLLHGGLRNLYAEEDGTLLGVWVKRPDIRRGFRGLTVVWDEVRGRYLVTSPRHLAGSLGKTMHRFER